MVTADKSLTYTQNMKSRKIALVVLPTNDWSTEASRSAYRGNERFG
jgi:hypothetical protein